MLHVASVFLDEILIDHLCVKAIPGTSRCVNDDGNQATEHIEEYPPHSDRVGHRVGGILEPIAFDDGMVMSVIGPGSMIGEMGLLDGEPRSASCTAATDLTAAVLPRDAMLKLIKTKSEVAARLMLAVSKRLSDRLREANRTIKTLDGMNRALQQELTLAHKLLGAMNSGGQRKP